MVSVIFKTVYLFLVLFTLPQVLAAPGPAIVDLHSRDDPDIITLHNRFRQDADLPPLTWNAALAGVARLQVTTCIKNEIPHIIGTTTDGLSLFTEDAYFCTDRARVY